MATTVYKGAYLPTVSGDSGVWGAKLNSSLTNSTFPVFDSALGGITTKTLSNADVTLSAAESGTAILRLTGTISAAINIVTSCQGFTFVENATTGSYAITVDNSVGTPLEVPQGVVSLVIFDATNGPRFGAVNFASDAEALAGTSEVKAVTPANLASMFVSHYRALQSQDVTASTTTLTIDMANGWNVNLTLSSNVSTFNVTNWPASGIQGKLFLNIASTGAFNISDWPGTTLWAGGTPPTITSGNGKKDAIGLTSNDGGTTFQGFIAGQDFS